MQSPRRTPRPLSAGNDGALAEHSLSDLVSPSPARCYPSASAPWQDDGRLPGGSAAMPFSRTPSPLWNMATIDRDIFGTSLESILSQNSTVLPGGTVGPRLSVESTASRDAALADGAALRGSEAVAQRCAGAALQEITDGFGSLHMGATNGGGDHAYHPEPHHPEDHYGGLGMRARLEHGGGPGTADVEAASYHVGLSTFQQSLPLPGCRPGLAAEAADGAVPAHATSQSRAVPGAPPMLPQAPVGHVVYHGGVPYCAMHPASSTASAGTWPTAMGTSMPMMQMMVSVGGTMSSWD